MNRLLAFSTFALLLLTTIPAPSSAQIAYTDIPQPWHRIVPTLLATELAGDDADRRGDAMLKIIRYGTDSDGSIQWAQVVQPLLAIYTTDVDYRNRRLAVAALHATDHPAGMKALRSLIHHESSPAVVVSTLNALVDHYGLGAFAGDRAMARLAERTLADGVGTGLWVSIDEQK